MWLFTRYGFFSVSVKVKGSDEVAVRARVRSHLDALMTRFPQIKRKVVYTAHNDYAYRVRLPKALWVKVAAALAQEQDWSNFKDEAKAFGGSAEAGYVDALHEVWAIMHSLQYRQGKGRVNRFNTYQALWPTVGKKNS
jgi:hypothetical protein